MLHFSSRVLSAAQLERHQGLEISIYSGDSHLPVGSCQGSPRLSQRGSNMVATVGGYAQGEGTLRHIVQDVPLGLFDRGVICRTSDRTVGHSPQALGLKVSLHLGFPFSVICPIEDGDMCGDVVVVGRRHSTVKQLSVTVELLNVEGDSGSSSVVPS